MRHHRKEGKLCSLLPQTNELQNRRGASPRSCSILFFPRKLADLHRATTAKDKHNVLTRAVIQPASRLGHHSPSIPISLIVQPRLITPSPRANNPVPRCENRCHNSQRPHVHETFYSSSKCWGQSYLPSPRTCTAISLDASKQDCYKKKKKTCFLRAFFPPPISLTHILECIWLESS